MEEMESWCWGPGGGHCGAPEREEGHDTPPPPAKEQGQVTGRVGVGWGGDNSCDGRVGIC